MKNIYVTKPVLPDAEIFKSHVDDIFHSGILTNFGSKHEELQRELQTLLGVEYLLLVANGTMALEIAIMTYLAENDCLADRRKILWDTTPFSFVATSSVLNWLNLPFKYLDVRNDGTVDDEKIRRPGNALLATNVYGNPCNFNKLSKIYRDENIIYDSSHSFGVQSEAEYFDKGYAHTLSLHATKVFSTCEGGAIIFKKQSSYELARKLINFGILNEERILPVGVNAKLSELHAAFGLSCLPKFYHNLQRRRAIAEHYNDKMFPS